MIVFLILSILLQPIATEGLFWTKQYLFQSYRTTEDFIDTLTSSKYIWFSADGWANVSCTLQIIHRVYNINLTIPYPPRREHHLQMAGARMQSHMMRMMVCQLS